MHPSFPLNAAMPPLRRSRRTDATPPYTKGWLSRCRRRSPRTTNTRATAKATEVDDPLAVLPDDVLFAILSAAFKDAADVARCAAACGRWRGVVLARAAAVASALPPLGRYVPHAFLGFFHGDQISRRRRNLVASRQPRFVPNASASLVLGPPPFPGLHGDGSGGRLLDHARVVASRNGRVVLELRTECRADGLRLCVCNPMTGDLATLPPLTGEDAPGRDYACAILCEDDLLDVDDDNRTPPGSLFRLLLVYNTRRGFTALRTYSSDSGTWGPEGRKPGPKIAGHVLRGLGPAAVLSGVAYWPVNNTAALGVRVDGAATMDGDVCSAVPYSMKEFFPDYRLLGVTPDGMLSYVSAGISGDDLVFIVEALDLRQGDMTSTAKERWQRREFICLTQFKVSTTTEIKLRWFGERSGTVLFTVGEGANTSGAFALNLATSSVEKLADGAECHAWRNLCGYDMDRAGLLAAVVSRL